LTQKNKEILFTFDSVPDLESSLSEFIKEKMETSVSSSDRFSIAISGGKTPMSLYRNLSEMNIDWTKIDLSLVDERYANPLSKDSNQLNILESLSVDKDIFRSFNSFEFTYDEHKEPFLRKKDVFNNLPFDICLLGMGKDGHFASIFPHLENLNSLLDENGDELESIVHSQERIPCRFTLTYKAISQSNCIIIYITGREKLSLIKKIIKTQVSHNEYPIKKIFNDFTKDLKIYWCK